MRMLCTYPLSRCAPFSRVSRAAQVCSFGFKTLRLHMDSSAKISENCIEPSYWINVGYLLSSVLSFTKSCVDLEFPPNIAHSLLTKTYLLPGSN